MTTATGETWKNLREAAGISQREAERRMGWKTGHLSWIERGIEPTEIQVDEMRRLYGALLLPKGEAS